MPQNSSIEMRNPIVDFPLNGLVVRLFDHLADLSFESRVPCVRELVQNLGGLVSTVPPSLGQVFENVVDLKSSLEKNRVKPRRV